MAWHQLVRYQLANQPSKWSVSGFVETVKRQTRLLLKRLYKKGEVDSTQFKVPIYRTPNTHEEWLERRFHFFRDGFFRRAAKWSRDSLAATLARRSGRSVFRGAGGCATVSFVGFVLASKPSLLTEQEELEGLSFDIRDAFSKVSPDAVCNVRSNCPPEICLEDLKIGNLIAKGCNAAVYSVSLKSPLEGKDQKEEEDNSVVNSEIHKSDGEPIQTSDLQPYNMALKVLFNYSAQSDASTIWRTMFKETLPAQHQPPLKTLSGSNQKIPAHPNIVEMYCAFADKMPLLPDALSHYPQALPYRLTKHGYGRNMTLFLIMKRYHCSLKDYLRDHSPSTRTELILLCQLLEGLVHLQQNNFVHRDLKTDNILLDLNSGAESPIAAITDFGCCLEGLQLLYSTEETNRGGNMALMAPEVVNAIPGPFTVIDYSRSDLWTLGTIAYEIFGGKNPFYMSDETFLEAADYSEQELPDLPKTVPSVIQKLIKDMLHKDPNLRPSPTLAATVCQLVLHAPPELLTKPLTKKRYNKVVHWMCALAGETFLRASLRRRSNESRSPEFLLRYSFCRRIQFLELIEALHYISEI